MTTLAAIRKTEFARRFVFGGRGVTEHRECWGAVTLDGQWSFDREDSPGTPWLVYHLPSAADQSYPGPVAMFGTLRGCRAFVGSGAAARALARLKAGE